MSVNFKSAYNIAGAIVVVGFASISVIGYIKSGGEIGKGWGLLTLISLFSWSWQK